MTNEMLLRGDTGFVGLQCMSFVQAYVDFASFAA